MGKKNDNGEMTLDDLESANLPEETEEALDTTGLKEPDEVDVWAEVEESAKENGKPIVNGEVGKYYAAIRDLLCILCIPNLTVIEQRNGKTNGHVKMVTLKATSLEHIEGGCRRKELTDFLEMHALTQKDPAVQGLVRNSRNIFQASFFAQVEVEKGWMEIAED